MIKYKPGMPFSWLPVEVANARREVDKDPLKKQLGDVAKLKGNSFYGKMIEDLGRHKSTKFTRKEMVVDKALRSPFFNNLEETGGTSEIKGLKRTVTIKRPYECGMAVYQLAKLRMLEFYYDFLDKYFWTSIFWTCALLQSATLLKMRHSLKINIAAKAFLRSIMICIFSSIKILWSLNVFLKTRRDSELEEKDIDKVRNVGFRICDQGIVT